MPFRSTFQCLWCGRTHRVRSRSDLEGWALLCPDCLGRAGENPFLRFRLRQAMADRSREGKLAGSAGSPRDDVHGGVAGDRADDLHGGVARDPADEEPGGAPDRMSARLDGTTGDAAGAAAGQPDPD